MTIHATLLFHRMPLCICLVALALPAQAGDKLDPKPMSSFAELSTIRGVVKAAAQAAYNVTVEVDDAGVARRRMRAWPVP